MTPQQEIQNDLVKAWRVFKFFVCLGFWGGLLFFAGCILALIKQIIFGV
jgi:hypothetical protein